LEQDSNGRFQLSGWFLLFQLDNGYRTPLQGKATCVAIPLLRGADYLEVREFRAIFFDLDGTLVDIHGPLYAAARTAIETLGVGPPLTRERYREALVKGDVWMSVPEDIRRDYMQLAYAYFLTEIDRTERLEALPHVVETLAELKRIGYLTGVVTRRPGSSQTLIGKLAMIGLACHLDLVITQPNASLEALDKTSSLKQAAVRSAVLPQACMYVGDEPRDTMAARKAGFGAMVAVATGPASYGRLSGDEQYRADYVMHSMAELPSVLDMFKDSGGL
jgi:phosphoglycolate phosphatase